MQIRQLDGLRGVALMLVLVFHAAPRPVERWEWYATHAVLFGWSGVDLFFVLSGFLITRILIVAKGQPRYFTNFYARRILRIFPVYYATLLVALVVWPALDPNWAFVAASHEGHLLWIYASNLPPILMHTAPDLAFPPGLAHFWSLMVEEHFYLLWPFLVYRLSRRSLTALCVALVPLCLGLRFVLMDAGYGADAIRWFTPARIDTLAMGSLVALLAEWIPLRSLVRRAKGVVVAMGVVLAVVALHGKGFFAYGTWMVTVGLTAFAVFWSAVLVCVVGAPEDGLLRRVLCARPSTFLGKYSYGAYVFHLPLFEACRRFGIFERIAGATHARWVAVPLFLVGYAAVVYLLAFLSYEIVERRFLRLKRFFEYGAESAGKNRAAVPL